MSSLVHIDNKGKHIFILRKGPTHILNNTSLTVETQNSINFTQPNRRFALSLYCNGSKSFFFFNATKIYQFKAKNPEIKDYALCLGNISNDFTINNMKKNRMKRSYIFFFC